MTNVPDVRAAVEWGWAGRALHVVSGDLHVVAPFPGGALVGLLDGLGHGPDAAEASITAVPLLEARASDSLLNLVQRCHEALRKTRGAVMSLASFSFRDSSMVWIGVGNVAGVLLRRSTSRAAADEALAVRAGVVGFRLPPLRANTLAVSPGDTLILATDGIRSGFATGLDRERGPQEIAECILARFARDSDDAHVVVARYHGEAP
ncbi:MAG: stage II sporulation protein E (SpoIIE) [Nitrospirae bacterium]|nr:MAG: stage II sporulation protein E (SpoIIE) [Nitrospirota bacterium]